MSKPTRDTTEPVDRAVRAPQSQEGCIHVCICCTIAVSLGVPCRKCNGSGLVAKTKDEQLLELQGVVFGE